MRLILSLLCAAVLLVAMPQQSAHALWGKAKTETEDGNAKMNLGEYNGLKHAIGCTDFENQAGWRGNWEIGNNLSIMLESALYDTGRFVIVEREKLKTILAEQDLAASGRTAKGKKVARTGVLRSARYIGTGAVTEVEDSQSGGGAGISFKGVRLGGGKSKAQVTIIAKLIDTSTGEIVAKQRIVGKAGNTKLSVGLSVGGLSTDLGGFKKTPLGQAAQDGINKAAEFFAKEMEEFPFEGSVIKVSGSGQVIINRGSQFGVEVGQELAMAEEGETLIDPDTGEILDEEDGELIGTLRVAKVKEKIAYCEVIDGETDPEKGTVVRAE